VSLPAIPRPSLARQDVDYDGEGSLWAFLQDLTDMMMRTGINVVSRGGGG
jgi:hypothetical protein